MTIPVQLWSYFRDLAGTASVTLELAEGATIAEALTQLYAAHPKLAALRNSTLIAVGVDYQGPDYVLQPGNEVSLFPPVQGG